MKRAPLYFAFSAPSGTGKSTLVKELLRRDPTLRPSVSYTTRSPREGEVDGREYHFVTRDQFESMRASSMFVETNEHFGNLYGTPNTEMKQNDLRDVVFDIDCVGAANLKRRFPQTRTIFLLPPSFQVLQQRSLGRNSGESEAEAVMRSQRALWELQQAPNFESYVVNYEDQLWLAVKRIERAIARFRLGVPLEPSYRCETTLNRIKATFAQT